MLLWFRGLVILCGIVACILVVVLFKFGGWVATWLVFRCFALVLLGLVLVALGWFVGGLFRLLLGLGDWMRFTLVFWCFDCCFAYWLFSGLVWWFCCLVCS